MGIKINNEANNESLLKSLWDNGYELFEIYTCNDAEVEYPMGSGKLKARGTITGYDIAWVIARPDNIKNYPLFDCIISKGDNSTGMATVAKIYH